MSPSSLTSQETREFAREIKFVLAPITAARVREWARERLIPDPNAAGRCSDTYQVTSLYFDTPAFDVYHRRGQHRHSKFRVRRYDAGPVFVERKLKVRGRLAKRRTLVQLDDVARFSGPAVVSNWPGRWFEQRVAARGLVPICQIGYERTARVLMTAAGPIRLTLDEAIRALPTDKVRFHEPPATTTPVTDRVVLELKYRGILPALFRELVEQFTLDEHPFSKYRAALPVLGLVEAVPVSVAGAGTHLSCQTS